MVTFLNYISNACQCFSGVAIAALNEHLRPMRSRKRLKNMYTCMQAAYVAVRSSSQQMQQRMWLQHLSDSLEESGKEGEKCL